MKRTLLVFLFVLCASYAACASSPQDASEMLLSAAERAVLEQNLIHAANLIQEGKTLEASRIYAALSARYPTNRRLALAVARAALAANDAETALPIYDRLLEEDPDNTDLRLEAARAHYAAGNEAEAIRLGRQVLSEYEDRDRLHIRGAVRAGVIYDSNVNQGPPSNNIRLGDWDVQLSDGEGKPSGGAYVRANVDMSYQMSAFGPWWFVGDFGAFWRGNFNEDLNDIDSRTSQWGRVAAGLRYLDGRNTFDIRLKGEIYDYDFENNVTAAGVELRYARVIRPRFYLITDAAFERREYSGSDDRDGNFGRVGAYGRFILGDSGHEFLIGGGYLSASANNNNYGYDGWHALARFSFKLPNGLLISPLVSFSQESYGGPATALETENRRDDRWRMGVELAYALSSAWIIEAAYYYTNVSSTSGLHTFDQHVINLGVARTF